MIPVIICAWIILSAQYVVFNYSLYTYRFGWAYEPNVLLGMIAGGTRYHAIWLLAFHLYHFARKSAEETALAAVNAQRLAEAQLSKLQSELNPHFLFNALNSIKALTREDPALARKAIEQLSDLLRYSLHTKNTTLIPIEEELKAVDTYTKIMKIRFEDRLTFNKCINENVLTALLPPLSLYTLVENAIKHGISRLEEGGSIEIQLIHKDPYLQILVSNPFSSANILTEHHAQTGLKNLESRLQLIYNDNYSYRHEIVQSKPHSIWQTSIKIPMTKNE
ncbi:MAG: histidine kinase [Bacteroidota bacterium]